MSKYDELIFGLKTALAKGQSLRQAMMSFYNSGYKKEDIEEAARQLQIQQIESESLPLEFAPKKIEKGVLEKTTNIPLGFKKEKQVLPKQTEQVKTTQEISNYEKPKKSNKKILIILLILILFALIGGLIALFLFRDEVMGFFSSLI